APAARKPWRKWEADPSRGPPAPPGVRTLAPPAISRLADIRVPTLVVVGADDWPPIHDIAELLTGQITGARKVVIPDAGHHPNMEHPAAFNEMVLSFLKSIPAG